MTPIIMYPGAMFDVTSRVIFVAIAYPICVVLAHYILTSLRVLFRGRGG